MKTPFSIKLIYWIVNFMFWVAILGIFSIAIQLFLFYIDSDSYDFLKFELPLKLELLPISEVSINEKVVSVKISKILGTFNIWELGIQTVIVYYTAIFFNSALLIYALQLVKKMIINVIEKSIFSINNVLYLKKASYAFFLVWVVKDIFIQSYIQIQYTYFNPFNNLFMDYLVSIRLVIAAILLATAYIFEQGVKLQREQSLTI